MDRDEFVQDLRNAWHPSSSTSYTLSSSQISLKLQYEQALIKAQYELEQLEMMDLNS